MRETKLGDGCDGREECNVTVKEKWSEHED